MRDRGLCWCGCGEKTRIAPRTSSHNHQVKGQPLRYLQGHHARDPEIRAKMAAGRKGRDNSNWRGGKRLQKRSGYVVIYVGHKKYEAEHRLVMEDILERKLLPDESVHHKNGVRHDNRPENLEVWSKYHPAGQRSEDLVTWAREILERYEGDA